VQAFGGRPERWEGDDEATDPHHNAVRRAGPGCLGGNVWTRGSTDAVIRKPEHSCSRIGSSDRQYDYSFFDSAERDTPQQQQFHPLRGAAGDAYPHTRLLTSDHHD
jgi:hypothetical protein